MLPKPVQTLDICFLGTCKYSSSVGEECRISTSKENIRIQMVFTVSPPQTHLVPTKRGFTMSKGGAKKYLHPI